MCSWPGTQGHYNAGVMFWLLSKIFNYTANSIVYLVKLSKYRVKLGAIIQFYNNYTSLQ